MTIHKGEDKIIEFTLTDDNDAPIVINSLDGLIVLIYQGETIFGRYSLNALAGYELITVTDSVNGVFEVNLKRAALGGGFIKDVKAEIKIQETDAAFDDSKLFTVATGICIDLLQDSLTKTITDLG